MVKAHERFDDSNKSTFGNFVDAVYVAGGDISDANMRMHVNRLSVTNESNMAVVEIRREKCKWLMRV